MFKFNPEKLITTERLGRDPKSVVHPYQRHPDDQRWVVKQIPAKDSREVRNLMQNIVLGFSTHHTAIIPIKGYFVQKIKPNGYNVYLKLPRMQENLCDFIKRQVEGVRGRPDENQVIKSLFNLANGLEYLHNRGLAHENIKPSNILLNEFDEFKLSDIGPVWISKEVLENGKGIETESSFYVAPEMMNRKGHIKKIEKAAADIWSLGLVFVEYCLLKQQVMNPHMNPKELIIDDLLNQVQRKYSPGLVELFRKMLAIDPKHRICAMDLIREMKEKFGHILGFKRIERQNVAPVISEIPIRKTVVIEPEIEIRKTAVIQPEIETRKSVILQPEIQIKAEPKPETKAKPEPEPESESEAEIEEVLSVPTEKDEVNKPKEMNMKESQILKTETKIILETEPANKDEITSDEEEVKINQSERKARTNTQESFEPKKRPRSRCSHQSESEISQNPLTITNLTSQNSDPVKLTFTPGKSLNSQTSDPARFTASPEKTIEREINVSSLKSEPVQLKITPEKVPEKEKKYSLNHSEPTKLAFTPDKEKICEKPKENNSEQLQSKTSEPSKNKMVQFKEASESILKDMKERIGAVYDSVVMNVASHQSSETKKPVLAIVEDFKPQQQRVVKPRESRNSLGRALQEKFSMESDKPKPKMQQSLKEFPLKAESEPMFEYRKRDMAKSENKKNNLQMTKSGSERKMKESTESRTSGVSDSVSIRWEFAMKELFVKWLKSNFEVKSQKTLQLSVSYSADSGYSFSKDELKDLMQDIIESTRKYSVDNLSELRLSLDGCNKVEEAEFQKLAVDVCQNLKVQKCLSLCFNRCYKLTDEGIKHLGNLIGSNLKHIQSLNLAFTGSPIASSSTSNTPLKITDEGLKYLVMNITQNLSGLKQLTLGFVGCPDITDEGIYYVAVAIGSSLKDLETLHLSFGRCEKVTDKGLAHLTTIINQNLPKIQKLTFGLWRTGVSGQSKEVLKKTLNNVPNFDIY